MKLHTATCDTCGRGEDTCDACRKAMADRNARQRAARAQRKENAA